MGYCDQIRKTAVLFTAMIFLKSWFYSFLYKGGFYSDDEGYVAESCRKCPTGSFVAFDKTPGKRPQDCKTCPEGNRQ